MINSNIKGFLILLQLTLCIMSMPTIAEPSEFFVAPQGNDNHPGSERKPFATFQRAQQEVRKLRQAYPERGVTVIFQPGHYQLQAPLEFTTEDSGYSATVPVTYRAASGNNVEISAGSLIDDWQPDSQYPNLWKTRITDKTWRFEQLWVNGQRAIRARTPDWWKFHTLNGVIETPLPGQDEQFIHTFAVQPEILEDWATLDESTLQKMQVVVFHKWDTTREWLQSVSPENGTFTTHGTKMQHWNTMTRDCLFYVENALIALDTPGEWFLDRNGWLYYYPRAGENMSRAKVVAPRLERFMTITGNTDQTKTRVQHLHFEGLSFRHADFHIPEEGIRPWQAVMNIDNATIRVDVALDIQFNNCAVEHIGSTAFWFRHACRDCKVEHTRIFDVGISGVRIGEEKLVQESERTGAITINNCIIQSGGRIGPSAVGVWIGHSADNIITHCDIADFFYTSVSVGWQWGYGDSGAKRNQIESNHLHHLGYRILSDMGGVYTLGPSEGTRVCNNVIHDIYSTRYGGWGLYPDEGSTGILYENNLVYNVRDGAFHQHYGRENIVRNNILAFSEEGQVAVTRAEPHLSFTFENNIVVWDEGTLLGYGGWKNGVKVNMRNNLYWRLGNLPFDFAGQSWEQWQTTGHDKGSVIANPLFVNVNQQDFRLQPESPAEQIGFKPFDYTKAGVYGTENWKQLAASISFPDPYVVPAPEPIDLHDDFEVDDITPLLNLASFHQEGRKDLITVTDTLAAHGQHCLHIQDSHDLHANYNPHFYWDPRYTAGSAHLSYQIRLEPGFNIHCEWRDKAQPYRVGPSLQFHSGGLYNRERKLLDIPDNQWLSINMKTYLGHNNSDWTLCLTLPDGSQREFKNLPCDPNWTEARWIGFSSSSPDRVSFYLDDVVMVKK